MTFDDFYRVVIQDTVWSAVAALGFALLFNVPKRTLLGCVVCGAIGHVVRSFLMQFGWNITPATLAGAAVVGILSVVFARRERAPMLVFAICGAIPMVPGSYAYRAMLGLIRISSAEPTTGEPILTETAIDFVTTGLILAALSLGIILPTLLFRRRRPVV